MAQAFPDAEGAEAIAGKQFHEIVAHWIDNAMRGIMYTNKNESLIHTQVPAETIEVAEFSAKNVFEVMHKHLEDPQGVVMGVERQVHAPRRIHPLSHGTVDCFLYDPKTRDLYIWDFKYGYGLVEVFQNWQLINYAAALFDEFNFNGLDDQTITVHFRIIQPRGFHPDGPIREWTVKGSDLRADFNILKMNAAKALSNDAITQSGAHCRYCPARHACRTALDAGMQLYELANKTTPLNLSPEALGVQYAIVKRAREQLEYLESGLSEEIKSRLRGGQRVPGFHMEPGRGRESWERPIKEIRLLGELMGVELGKDEVVTPFQARKLGIDSAILDRYVSIPKRGNKLVADAGSQAKRIFATVGAMMP